MEWPLGQLLQEEEHLFRALTRCKYPTWAIKRARMRSQNSNNIRTRRTNQTGQKNKTDLYMVVPYYQGLSERIKRSCNKFGVQVFFKGGQTIRNLLMAPKDKDPITNKSGVIYRFKCSQHGCKEEYIGESARNFAERFKEHQKAPSPIFDHCNISGHNININNFTIVGREDQNLTGAIKEALFIRVNDPFLNRNIGKYHLPHIWDEFLHTTSELKLNWPSGHSIKPPWQQHQPSHPWVDITSTTKAITSAYCICGKTSATGNNISQFITKGNNISLTKEKKWQ